MNDNGGSDVSFSDFEPHLNQADLFRLEYKSFSRSAFFNFIFNKTRNKEK